MCVYMRVYAHTHTEHGVFKVNPGVGTRHLDGPKVPDGLNLSTYLNVHVYKVHKCMYMLGSGMRSWTEYFFSSTCFFLPKKQRCDCKRELESKLYRPSIKGFKELLK